MSAAGEGRSVGHGVGRGVGHGVGEGGIVVAIDVEAGADPMPEFMRAWERGARVLPLARTLPASAREALVARACALRAEPAAGMVLPTSGSSGVPRLIDLPLDAMRASAELGARVIPFGAGDLWHASLAPSHIGGVMILMRAWVLGGRVRFGAQPRAWRELDGCTHVSLVAAQLARLLEDPSPVPASLKAVMLGGGPSPQPLRDAAIARGVPLFATYGLTETSSQVATVRLATGDTATLAGPALPGVAISLDAAAEGCGGFEGRIGLEGCSGFEGSGGASGEILVDGPTLARGEIVDGAIVPLARPLRTRDVGALDTQGRLHVIGRLDSMFISGGKNIHPEVIERALAAIAGVRSACVVGVPHVRWGMRPLAFVDLAPAGLGVTPTRAQLRETLHSTLESHLVPDAILAMPADEAAAMKPSRARLAARLAAGERFDELD